MCTSTLPLGVFAVLMKTRSALPSLSKSAMHQVPVFGGCRSKTVAVSSMNFWYLDLAEAIWTSTLPLGVLAVLMKTRSALPSLSQSAMHQVPVFGGCRSKTVAGSSMNFWYLDLAEAIWTSTLPLGVLAVLMKTRSALPSLSQSAIHQVPVFGGCR